MNDFLSGIGSVIATIGIVILLIMGVSFGGYYAYAYFNPKYVAVDNKTFHESQQYNDGMNDELSQLQIHYNECAKGTAGDGCREVIRGTVQHDFASYPEDRLTPQLRSFYAQMIGETP